MERLFDKLAIVGTHDKVNVHIGDVTINDFTNKAIFKRFSYATIQRLLHHKCYMNETRINERINRNYYLAADYMLQKRIKKELTKGK